MILIGLGANLPTAAYGPPEGALGEALRRLAARGAPARARSRLWRSSPVPASAQPDYVNAAARVETALAPRALLDAMQAIEQELGRLRRERWGPRTIDLDLLAYGAVMLDGSDLTLPHPRLAERAFVLLPVAEVAPGWRHPASGRAVEELIGRLPAEARAGVSPAC